jgi:hypothetical protein
VNTPDAFANCELRRMCQLAVPSSHSVDPPRQRCTAFSWPELEVATASFFWNRQDLQAPRNPLATLRRSKHSTGNPSLTIIMTL